MYHQIINPKTNRKVSIYKKKGQQILRTYINQLNRSSIWFKLLIVFIVFIVIRLLFFGNSIRKESFINSNEQFVYHKGGAIYDGFYSNIYDVLVYNNVKNEYEFLEFKKATKPNKIFPNLGYLPPRSSVLPPRSASKSDLPPR